MSKNYNHVELWSTISLTPLPCFEVKRQNSAFLRKMKRLKKQRQEAESHERHINTQLL